MCRVSNVLRAPSLNPKCCQRFMNNSLAPEPVLRAALRVLHLAAFTTRNWGLSDEVSRKQICDLWEAMHEVPVVITRWRGDEESMRELQMYLREYTERWGTPNLEAAFDQGLDNSLM